MENKEQQDAWNDIKDIWNLSSEVKEISIAVNELVEELKYWTSPFEQDSVKKDIIIIKSSLSQFEKDAINKDIERLERSVNEFEKGFTKSISKFVIRVVKKIISIIKVKND